MFAGVCEKSYGVAARLSNFYSGGDIAWSNDGKYIFCLNTTEVCQVDKHSGQLLQTFTINSKDSSSGDRPSQSTDDEGDDDVIYTFAVSPANEFIVTGHRSGLLRLWSLESGEVVKLWKALHRGPVVKLSFSPDGKLICSSGSDSSLRVWDFATNRCLAVIKDFTGPALVVEFHPSNDATEIYAAGSDNTIYCWNYKTKELLHTFRGHLSQVTAFGFHLASTGSTRLLTTVSRDKVLITWDLKNGKQQKVIPLYEELEGVCLASTVNEKSDEQEAIVVTSKGSLKLVNCKTGKIATIVESIGYEAKYLMHCPNAQQLAIVTAEQNILIYDVTKDNRVEICKQLIGFNDEILDMSFLGEDDRFLAVATNSKNIKIYDSRTDMNCRVIVGHKDTVMTLSSPGYSNFLLTAGRDFSINLWELDQETFTLKCLVTNPSGHTSTIGSISFCYNSTAMFASACQDGSLKVWNIKVDKSKEYSFSLKYAAVAHDKEVNCVTFSPNNKIIATASQDKTVKLWSSETSSMTGVLRGHTRGVWCVRFSPVDQIVLSASSDCSMRVWSLASMSCLKRLEQDCTVLRAEFIDDGRYIISTASDGLIKVWNIKTNACVQTLAEHEDRVWSLAVSNRTKKSFYSGGADSTIIKWSDVTEQNRNAEIDKRQELVQQEQLLQTLLQQKKSMQKAFVLALKLQKPRSSFRIVSQLVRQRDFDAIKNIVSNLNNDQRDTLLEHVAVWCTNSRQCQVANFILNYLLSDHLAGTARHFSKARHLVESITPYLQRHFNRVSEINKELAFLDFLVQGI